LRQATHHQRRQCAERSSGKARRPAEQRITQGDGRFAGQDLHRALRQQNQDGQERNTQSDCRRKMSFGMFAEGDQPE
jgi:hypothetical protein